MLPPTLHIHLLGDFLLVSGDTPVSTLNGSRLQSLLAYLVLHRSTPQDRSRLAFLLWPDSTETQAHTNLRKLLYHLRQSLPHADRLLHIDHQSLQWLPTNTDGTFTLDIQEMEQDTQAMCHALEGVVRLYRGDLLSNCYDEWILPERDRLRQVFLGAAERVITLKERQRDYHAALIVAQQLLRHDPLHEATYRQLMRLYALCGDRVAALRLYHLCATTLERELGVEPSVATSQIYESLLQMDTLPSSQQTVTPSSRGIRTPFVGRAQEWAHLQEAWQRALRSYPHMVLLSGEAGIGKTYLAEEFEAWVSRQGMKTAVARCYGAEGRLAYAPVTSWLQADSVQTNLANLNKMWLSEIARLDPGLRTHHSDLLPPAPITEGWQRQHLFEALAHAFLDTHQPLLLLLDDLHWCDHETLEWLHYLFRFDREARLFLVGTVRLEEMPPGHPLVALLSALQREGLFTEIALGPLSPSETTTLAEQVARQPFDLSAAKELYKETEGNPLFVVEMVRAGTATRRERTPGIDQNVREAFPLLTSPTSTLPPTMQAVLATRLAQLSPAARRVANMAAVIGREFAFPVLVEALRESEEVVVQELDELWQRRLVREQGATYDFSHDKLRVQAYSSLSSAHRRLLHRRVAEAFEIVYAKDLDVVSGQIAAHYELAGLPGGAIPYYQRAGEVASRIYANEEAMRTYTRATALLEIRTPGSAGQHVSWELAAQVHESLGDVSTALGRHQEASQAYHHALMSVAVQAPLWQARLHRKVARSWRYLSSDPGDIAHINARQAFQEAQRILADTSDASNPMWRHEWIEFQFAQIWQTWPLRGSVEDMIAIIEKVQSTVEQHGTEEQRELLAYALAVRDLIRNRYVKSISEQHISARLTALAALEQAGNESRIGRGHFGFGVTLLWSGHLNEAEEHLSVALQIGEHIGDAILQMRCLTFLPFISRRRGQVEQVRNLFTQAQTVGAVQNNSLLVGHRAWIAWRDGNLVEAESYGRASIENEPSQRHLNPLQWVGLWPLIGVALAQENIADAMDNVRILLDPLQQQPPEHLRTLLEMALHVWGAGEPEKACALLQQALPLAEQMCYL